MSESQTNERTPLLPPPNPIADLENGPLNTESTEFSLTYIEKLVDDRAVTSSLGTAVRDTAQELFPNAAALCSALILLICLRRIEDAKTARLAYSTSAVAEAEILAKEEWGSLVESLEQEELDRVLWKAFRLHDSIHSQSVQAIDYFFKENVPEQMSLHPKAIASVMHRWTTSAIVSANTLELIVTPRVLHACELITLFAHIVLLTWCILFPSLHQPYFNYMQYDWRATLLQISCLSFIFQRPGSATVIPFLLTFLSTLSSFPALPRSLESSYTFIIIALGIHILQLHIPLLPGPIFISPRSNAFALSNILMSIIQRVVLPATFFFLPVIVVSFMLLSFSLSDILFLSHLSSTASGTTKTHSLSNIASPPESRLGFLIIFSFALLFTLCLAFVLLTTLQQSHQSLTVSTSNFTLWDRHGISFGLQARRALAHAALSYSQSSYYFCCPFNLLQVLFIGVPAVFIQLAGKKGAAQGFRQTAEKVLWRVTVLPFALIVAGVWGWRRGSTLPDAR